MYPNPADAPVRTPVTLPQLREKKRAGERIVVVTAYDASFAAQADLAGVDVVLVGDSLGMVVQGKSSTLSVSMDAMAYHTGAVARGLRSALLIADMPFMSFASAERAYDAAARLMGSGAAMVKLEGGGWVNEVIARLSERDVPVCAHLGLTPQSVHKLGGYKVQGREEAQAEQLLQQAQEVAAAGAELLVLECVPAALAQRITATVSIPTIGIGAGPHCDGQVLVLHDLLGVTVGKRPRFTKDFLAGRGSVREAFAAYAAAVRSGEFPAAEHSF